MAAPTLQGLLQRPRGRLRLPRALPPLPVALVLLPLATSLGAQDVLSARDIDDLPRSAPDHRIWFGEDSLHFGDLRLPEGEGLFPVAIVIHGGCWVERFADLEHTSPVASALREAGVATWNIEYRRLDMEGGGWPGTFLDVALAADHLRELAGDFPLDLNRVVALGHSAGGHLAGWLAQRHRLPPESPLHTPDPLPLRDILSLGGPLDLALFDGLDARTCGLSVVRPLLGDPDTLDPGRLADASPAERLPLGTPQWLIAGALDRILPGEHAEDYVARAREAGDRAWFLPVPEQGHFEVIAPGTPAWEVVEREVLRILSPER